MLKSQRVGKPNDTQPKNDQLPGITCSQLAQTPIWLPLACIIMVEVCARRTLRLLCRLELLMQNDEANLHNEVLLGTVVFLVAANHFHGDHHGTYILINQYPLEPDG